MPNLPGTSQALPGAYSRVTTLSRGSSTPGGTRLAVLMGEGSRRETLVSNANGSGNDGLNSTYTSTTDSDGRHFQLTFAPVISNRTSLFRNGIPLTLLEQAPSASAFDSRYDARIDITNGRIEMQSAALVDQGGAYYSASALNTGNGTIASLTLIDPNAPSETWTIRCVSVRRDGYGDPITGEAKFIAQGSVSGILLDGYGQQIVWKSDGVTVNNTILQFSISEGATTFVEGDRFTIEVQSGVLSSGDSLTATYIATIDINDIEFFDDLNLLYDKHGAASLSNRLSLGAQIAFANTPPGVWTIQTAPCVPRRVSYLLESGAAGSATSEDLQFALPLGVIPDANTGINFFVTDPTTGVETQILPNKEDFYNSAITASPSLFHFGAYTYSYTVVLEDSVQKEGSDGELTALTGTTAELTSDTVGFNIDDLGATRSLRIFDSASTNDGDFTITGVSDGVLSISRTSGTFTTETSVRFQVLDSASKTAAVLFTDDLALAAGELLRATIVDQKDATFFDVGWQAAYDALEKIDVDIVVPLPSQTISQVFQNGRVHVAAMSNIKNRLERVLFIGAIRGLEPEHVLGTEQAAVEDIGILEGIQGDDVSEILSGNVEDLTNYSVADAFGATYRVVYFYPDEVVVQIGADRVFVDGFFQAAAAAGYLSSVSNIAIPLTQKVISGITILRDKIYRPLTLEQLSVSGITVLQPTQGGGRVIWGRTTTQSGFVEEQEISIVFIRDRVAKSMRAGFAGFIGGADSSTLQGALLSRATGLLKGFKTQGLITDYKNLKVARDSVDPTQWNVYVSIQPTYPINFVFIDISIGLL